MSTVLIIAGSIILFLIIASRLLLLGAGTIKQLIIKEVDLKKIKDGTYTGVYKKSRWTYEIEVIIKNHKITSVKNLNKKMDKMMGDLNEKLSTAVMEKQSPVIDTVSGATINTRAFQKAVENALTKNNNVE